MSKSDETPNSNRREEKNESEPFTTKSSCSPNPSTGITSSPKESIFTAKLSLRFMLVTVVAASFIAFSFGRAARTASLKSEKLYKLETCSSNERYCDGDGDSSFLPSPKVEHSKMPCTKYTSMNFGATVANVKSANMILHSGKNMCDMKTPDLNKKENGDHEDKSDEIVDLRRGPHLLVDINGVDSEFLDSQHRLATALVETCKEANLTMLSYHCHTMQPAGVSCIGMMLQGHLSFHTWPEEGVITLDLYSSSHESLGPAFPEIKRLFGVPRKALNVDGKETEQVIRSSYYRRGFGYDEENDVDDEVLSFLGLDYRQKIASVQTKFQVIDIYDVAQNNELGRDRQDEEALSYQRQHPQMFQPDRLVFLDGVMQSTRDGEIEYHEALVHPVMFAHETPERVAIIGGGEGATLREVLKHNTVKESVMVEIDEKMPETAIEFLPSWCNCSDFVGSADVCFDDPRVTMQYNDALQWFIDRYSIESAVTEESLFDVIIVDLLDPNDSTVAELLYTNITFISSLYHALSDNGILVMQTGQASELADPPDEDTSYENRAVVTGLFEEVGFESITAYSEGHCGFGAPRTFLVAFKENESREKWYASETEVEIAMSLRATQTRSGQSPFEYFDGVTMKSYQIPHKVFEATFCRKSPYPKECDTLRGFDVSRANVPVSSMEVKQSGVGANAGRGVFTTQDISQGTYIAAETSFQMVVFPPPTYELLFEEIDEAKALDPVRAYADGYGFEAARFGIPQNQVDSSIMAFTNHGCNGRYNVGWAAHTCHVAENEEAGDGIDVCEEELMTYKVYNPVLDRHLKHYTSGSDVAQRDIAAGEEILCNYVLFVEDENHFADELQNLRAVCNGDSVGSVTKYEEEQRKS